jgi:hypothetical protein
MKMALAAMLVDASHPTAEKPSAVKYNIPLSGGGKKAVVRP